MRRVTFNNTNECWDQQEKSLKTDKQTKKIISSQQSHVGVQLSTSHASAIAENTEGPS